MQNTIIFFLNQAPLLWASMFATFFGIGLMYAWCAWYVYADRLEDAETEQEFLLAERSAVGNRRQPPAPAPGSLSTAETRIISGNETVPGLIPGLVPKPLNATDAGGKQPAPPNTTTESPANVTLTSDNPWIQYRKGDHLPKQQAETSAR